MKKIYYIYLLFVSLAASFLASCNDWTETEAESFPEGFTSDEYYAALRAYKQTKHQVAFGWYSGWNAEGAFMKTSLAGIPDSMDIVSIWDNGLQISEAQKRDMEFVRKVKGTKIIYCAIIDNIGKNMTPPSATENWQEKGYANQQAAVYDFWGWPKDETDTEAIENAIRTYARAIADTLSKYNYDGFDIDYEPNYGYAGNMAGHKDRMKVFIEELGKFFGPKSGTGRLLVVDGEPQNMPSEAGPYLDYFIIQAYSCSGDANLNSRLAGLVANYNGVMDAEEVTNKLIMTENFEAVDVAMNGGYDFTDSYGNKMKSLEGMARWTPNNGFGKAGVGVYRMEAEFGTNPEYKNMRNAIQIMNPSSHILIKY